MGRNITSRTTVTRRRPIPVGGGVFKAPPNLAHNRVLMTGCASGGSSGSTSGAPTLSGGCYGSGLFYCTNSVAATSPGVTIDAYTRAKHSSAATAINSYAGGGWGAASEDGFVITTAAVGTASPPFAVSRNYGETWSNFSQTNTTAPPNGVAVSPLNTDLALISNTDRYIEFTVDRGVTWKGSATFNFAANMAVMKGCKFLKDRFVLFGGITAGTAGVNTCIDIPSATYANWTQTTVFAAKTVNDIEYDPVSGVFVAVGDTGSIATATSLAGPWTQRTSGATDNLNGVKFGGGVWIAAGDAGRVCRSVDNGVTWTTATVGITTYSGSRSLAFAALMGANGTWFLRNNGGSPTMHCSRDSGATWSVTTGPTGTVIIASPVSALGFAAGGVSITRDGDAWYSHQTIRDGGDFVVVDSAGEKLRLAGGQGTTSTSGGDGGSTEGFGSKASTQNIDPGVGEGGNGANFSGTTLMPATGAGGSIYNAGANNMGGGAARQLADVIGLPGRKFPGGSGCATTTGKSVGGGSSMFGRAGMGSSNANSARGQGPGGGAGSDNGLYGSAGGAESCYKYEVAVAPGATLYISCGWKNDDVGAAVNFAPNTGTALIEWEEYV